MLLLSTFLEDKFSPITERKRERIKPIQFLPATINSDQFKMSGFVDLLFQIGVNFGHSEEIPKYMIKDLSSYLLHTLGRSLNVDVVNRLAKQLYDVDSHPGKKKKNRIRLAEFSARRPIISTIPGTLTQPEMTKNGQKLAKASASGSIISTNHDISFQYLIAARIGGLLAEMIFSQQIEAPDSLYSHVKTAVEALQVASRGSRCVIGGEPINVDVVNDKLVPTASYGVLQRGRNDGSASACLYNLRRTTSYLNATIQCLHRVPELKAALTKWHPLFETSCDHLLTAATRDLFKQLDKNAGPVAPRVFLQLFEEMNPMLGLRDNHNPKEAETCWNKLLGTLSSKSHKSTSLRRAVKELFKIKFVCRNARESGEKPPKKKSVWMLEWHESPMVFHFNDGLRSFVELGEDNATSFCIGRLPRYLTIRFFRTGQSASNEINLFEVDAYEMCSDELRAKLQAVRKRAGMKVCEKSSSLKDPNMKMSDAKGSLNGNGDSCKAPCKEGVVSEQETLLTGVYRLFAILSYHKSFYPHRAKYKGHYDAFFKRDKKSDRPVWFHYIDENVFRLREEHIIDIMTGAWGYAPYICLYRALVLKPKTSAQVAH